MSQEQDAREQGGKEAPPKKSSRPKDVEATQRETSAEEQKRALDEKREADELERKMARVLSIGIPLASVIGFVAVSLSTNLSLGLLVLAGGAMLGTISLFWSSVRTLGGDAPLPEGLAARVFANEVDTLEEEKRATLRILKDLEHERAVGKIDEFDYAELVRHYRGNAMAIMQALEARGEEFTGDMQKHLAALFPKDTLSLLVGEEVEGGASNTYGSPATTTSGDTAGAADAPSGEAIGRAIVVERVDCATCKTPNEPDAVFCKSCGAKMHRAAASTEETGGEK